MGRNINYNGKRFAVLENSENGALGPSTIFEYQQKGNIIHCTYQGEQIVYGHLLGVVNEVNTISLTYHQVDWEGKIRTGICTSTPEIMKNGKIRLHESWQWTSGDRSKGNSILEEC